MILILCDILFIFIPWPSYLTEEVLIVIICASELSLCIYQTSWVKEYSRHTLHIKTFTLMHCNDLRAYRIRWEYGSNFRLDCMNMIIWEHGSSFRGWLYEQDQVGTLLKLQGLIVWTGSGVNCGQISAWIIWIGSGLNSGETSGVGYMNRIRCGQGLNFRLDCMNWIRSELQSNLRLDYMNRIMSNFRHWLIV